MDEREQFLAIFDKFNVGDDSSDADAAETREFIRKKDLVEISIGDKIYVKEGELQGAIGQIMEFDDNGNQVIFRPTNLDGFEENLAMDKSMLVKYF